MKANLLSIDKTDRRRHIVAFIYFCTYLIICLFCLKDYGVTVDESAQRQHSLVAYKAINEKIFGRHITQLSDYPDIEEYPSLYGTAIQMPMVLIEDINGFSLDISDVFHIRHIFTFIVVYLGYICTYFAANKIYKNKSWTPLIVVIMLSLYPRFFAFQFFDVKNLMFSGLSMITIYSLICAVTRNNSRSRVAFAVSAALTTNTRIMGVMYPVILVGYYLFTDIYSIYNKIISANTNKRQSSWVKGLGKYVIVIATYYLVWIMITPFAWTNPNAAFSTTFETFAHYEKWNGTMAFMGNLITCEERPWYYLFVWLGISVPVLYLALFAIGNVSMVWKICRVKSIIYNILYEYKWEVFFSLLFWGAVWTVIIINSRIAVGWHHMFFVFVPFCYVSGFGIERLLNSKRKAYRTICVFVCLIALLLEARWMYKNHPKEAAYFNIIGRKYADQFDRDEWTTSSYLAIKWILTQEKEPVSVRGSLNSLSSLSKEQRSMFIQDENNPKYIINGYRNVIGNEITYEGYEEVYTITVDNYNVCSVFKRADNS